ncbi:hypothetical protein [Streptomyces sclerotialus]|uniref:hypothetical protein n=1 Tax=Streptomyces sclerotialus TaxID=1957 RepID=UPI0004C5249A
MRATGRTHRSAAWTLLVLLAVVFAPLLCRTGGAAPAAAAPQHPVTAPHATADGHLLTAVPDPAPVATSAPKRCSQHDAPGSGESAPAPATHRGEPLAAPAAAPVPYLGHAPACCALARPPTGPAPATDPCALLPVLRI